MKKILIALLVCVFAFPAMSYMVDPEILIPQPDEEVVVEEQQPEDPNAETQTEAVQEDDECAGLIVMPDAYKRCLAQKQQVEETGVVEYIDLSGAFEYTENPEVFIGYGGGSRIPENKCEEGDLTCEAKFVRDALGSGMKEVKRDLENATTHEIEVGDVSARASLFGREVAVGYQISENVAFEASAHYDNRDAINAVTGDAGFQKSKVKVGISGSIPGT